MWRFLKNKMRASTASGSKTYAPPPHPLTSYPCVRCIVCENDERAAVPFLIANEEPQHINQGSAVSKLGIRGNSGKNSDPSTASEIGLGWILRNPLLHFRGRLYISEFAAKREREGFVAPRPFVALSVDHRSGPRNRSRCRSRRGGGGGGRGGGGGVVPITACPRERFFPV